MNALRTLRYAAPCACLLVASSASADQDRFALTNDAWKAECGSCHVAYPPQLLPAESWVALFAGLDDHFGSDATLDAATAAKLLNYARTNAARAGGGKPSLRITQTRWWLHEHDEVRASTWKNPKVGGPANCAACHTGAERGDYDDDLIHIPR